MKKIIPFILFIPLLFFSIYLGYTQYTHKQTNNSINLSVNKEMGSSKINTATPIPTSPPIVESKINLVITSPESGTTVDGVTITVKGSTKPSIDVVVNDKELVSGTDGSFEVVVPLDEGDNYISIVAFDEVGNVAEREIMITRTTSDI